MYGRKVKLRFLFLSTILLILILTVFLVLKSLEENVIYFQSPSEINSLTEITNNNCKNVNDNILVSNMYELLKFLYEK